MVVFLGKFEDLVSNKRHHIAPAVRKAVAIAAGIEQIRVTYIEVSIYHTL